MEDIKNKLIKKLKINMYKIHIKKINMEMLEISYGEAIRAIKDNNMLLLQKALYKIEGFIELIKSP